MSRPPLEVADLIRSAGAAFIERNHQWLSWKHIKVLLAIARCRTAALGGHLDQCTRCGHRATISYNSCRNRHCPKCQTAARERWIAARQRELLPTRYVQVVFTLPPQLAPLALQNKKISYDLLFRASAETLLEVARDPQHLGAEIGFSRPGHRGRMKPLSTTRNLCVCQRTQSLCAWPFRKPRPSTLSSLVLVRVCSASQRRAPSSSSSSRTVATSMTDSSRNRIARKSSSSREESSAQCRSSRTSSSGASPVSTPRTRTNSRCRRVSMSPVLSSISQPTWSRKAATNGPNASPAPTSGADSPVRTCTSSALACEVRSSTSRVLPMPASPVIRTSPDW